MAESARGRFERALRTGIETLGLRVDDDVPARLGLHYALMVRWANRINLTTVTDPVEAAHRHALDCLLFADGVDDNDGDAVDVGSGAGFPGLVLAVARPRLRMTLLEPIRKRTSFLRVAVAELGLSNVRVMAGKLLPAVSGDPWPTRLLVSRATIPPLDLIDLAGPVLAPGGRVLLTGGQGLPPEAQVMARASKAGLRHVSRRAYTLPDGAPRWLDALERPGDAALCHD